MAFYEDVSSVTLGSTSITTVQSITSNLNQPMVGAGGDADAYDTAVIKGRASRSGSIVLADVSQARALEGASGTLSFVDKGASGGSDKTISIDNVQITDVTTTSAHGAGATATVNWIAYSSDGTTDPQSES